MPHTLTVAGDGVTLDLLLWRRHGRRGIASEILAATLDANPGVAALGPILPLGSVVALPDLPAAPAETDQLAVSLFD